jgi:hypothetical protein
MSPYYLLSLFESVAPSTANSNGMPSVVGERTLPVASLIEVGSTTREQASESDVHDSIERDEDGCAVEILHQFRQHFNMSKAELLDYVNNYVPAHTDKSVFSGEILLEQENDAPIRWLAGAQTLGLGFDVSKTMGMICTHVASLFVAFSFTVLVGFNVQTCQVPLGKSSICRSKVSILSPTCVEQR